MTTTPDATEKRPPLLGPSFNRTINYRDHSHRRPVILLPCVQQFIRQRAQHLPELSLATQIPVIDRDLVFEAKPIPWAERNNFDPERFKGKHIAAHTTEIADSWVAQTRAVPPRQANRGPGTT